jgi:hypothetical protein
MKLMIDLRLWQSVKILERSRELLIVVAFLLLGVKQIKLLIFVLNKLALIGGDACGLIITQVFLVTLYRVIVILSSK